MAKTDLTAARLRELLHYNPDTGAFSWREPKRGRRASGVVGTVNRQGYHVISIDGVKYMAHRLAWCYVFGNTPAEFIDHINGSRTDNRLNNLREATNGENNQNRKSCSSHNKSGYLGVSRCDSKAPKWHARIRVSNKVICLGSFATPEIAHQAYLEAKRDMHLFNTL